MNKSMFQKLAFHNIRRNKNTFLPFAISNTIMIAMFFMLLSIKNQAAQATFFGANTIEIILGFGSVICGIFSLGVIYYTNGFLMKRRKNELGLYSILGLEKKHIAKVLFWEIILIGLVSIIGGIFLGLLFSKLMYLILIYLLKVTTALKFSFSLQPIYVTTLLFLGVFLVSILYNSIGLIFLKPLELLKGGEQGEREPKAKWLLAILGLISLGIGYYIALTVENAMEAFSFFFVAVLFVIVGTYLLFISGSVVLFKCLKKNKKYYYHKTHFITISGLMYRMKQNAVGLANICILSTAVLVVLSSTVSLYLGLDDAMRTRYPKDVMTDYLYFPERDAEEGNNYRYDNDLIVKVFQEQANLYQVELDSPQGYYDLITSGVLENEKFSVEMTGMLGFDIIQIMTLEDFLQLGYLSESDQTVQLEDNQIFLYTNQREMANLDHLTIEDQVLQVLEQPSSKKAMKEFDGNGYESTLMVVSNLEKMIEVEKLLNANSEETGRYSTITYHYETNLIGSLDKKEDFSKELRNAINAAGIPHVATVTDIFNTRAEITGIYGSLLFIGIFIGTMFLMTTVMIIYYKQISEGYDDRKRFRIMQKVGMSNQEVKIVIKNQIITIFFLPIVLAVIHIMFAFSIIRKLLSVMDLENVSVFIGCTIGTIVVFFLIYLLVYSITAKAYYKIVEMDE